VTSEIRRRKKFVAFSVLFVPCSSYVFVFDFLVRLPILVFLLLLPAFW